MNITLLANRDLASNLALNYLLPLLAGEHRLRVFLSDRVGSGENRPQALQELRFFEQSLFNELLFPALDQAGDNEGLHSFTGLGIYTCAPTESLNQVNSPDSLARLRESAPELIVSIRYGDILREDAISIPERGVINLHSGLLPEYRGVMATFRAMLNGEPEIGATLHYINDAGIDTGPVIGYSTEAVTPGKSYLWHVLRLYPGACRKLVRIIEGIARGEVPEPQPQVGEGHYYGFPDDSELQQFHDLGHQLYTLDEITSIGRQFLGVTPC